MPENEPEPPQAPTEQEVEQPEKYTDEWYDSVEKRFKDLGEFIRSGKATHTTTEPESAPTPAAPRQRQSPSDAEADGTVGEAASPARDTRSPKPSHFWFRRLGE